MNKKKLVIVGAGEFAEIAYEYFTHDSSYTVCGFAVESSFMEKQEFYNLPVYPLETLENHIAPNDAEIFTAITFTKLNRVRKRIYENLKSRGYRFASYVSSKAFVWKNATIGENCFIFENNVIQHHVSIGNNVILWSGNHIGHRSVIKDHSFISSHVVVSGYSTIGESCFIGVNSTLIDNIVIGDDCFIGAACLINKNVADQAFCTPDASHVVSKISSLRFFKIKED